MYITNLLKINLRISMLRTLFTKLTKDLGSLQTKESCWPFSLDLHLLGHLDGCIYTLTKIKLRPSLPKPKVIFLSLNFKTKMVKSDTHTLLCACAHIHVYIYIYIYILSCIQIHKGIHSDFAGNNQKREGGDCYETCRKAKENSG